MKALITGGHGFIGSFLVEKLLKEGWNVRCLVRKTSQLQWIKSYPIELYYGDVNEPQTLIKAASGVDYIFHVAAVLKGVTSDSFYKTNFQGTLNLADAALKYAPNLKRFIFISSVAAAGPHSGSDWVTEAVIPNPVSDYGKSKLAAEKALKEKYPTLPLTIIRPPIVLGPRDQHALVLFKMAKFGFFPIPAPYDRYYSIVHVDDLVNGIYMAAISDRAKGQTYFMCNPEVYSFKDLARALSKPFSKNPKFIYVPSFVVRGLAFLGDIFSVLTKKGMMLTSKKVPEIMATSWVFSPEKAKRELHFETQLPMAEGVQKTVQWYRDHQYL